MSPLVHNHSVPNTSRLTSIFQFRRLSDLIAVLMKMFSYFTLNDSFSFKLKKLYFVLVCFNESSGRMSPLVVSLVDLKVYSNFEICKKFKNKNPFG